MCQVIEEFREKFNHILIEALGLSEDDYYSRMNVSQFIQLRSVLNGLNNIITLKLTLGFAKWVASKFNFTEEEKELIVARIQDTHPNANGYDIKIDEPIKLLAEVKCNTPINNGALYGAHQGERILNDIAGLINANTNDYMKFMVFLDDVNIRAATETLLGNNNDEITNYDDNGRVYIKFIKLN